MYYLAGCFFHLVKRCRRRCFHRPLQWNEAKGKAVYFYGTRDKRHFWWTKHNLKARQMLRNKRCMDHSRFLSSNLMQFELQTVNPQVIGYFWQDKDFIKSGKVLIQFKAERRFNKIINRKDHSSNIMRWWSVPTCLGLLQRFQKCFQTLRLLSTPH